MRLHVNILLSRTGTTPDHEKLVTLQLEMNLGGEVTDYRWNKDKSNTRKDKKNDTLAGLIF